MDIIAYIHTIHINNVGSAPADLPAVPEIEGWNQECLVFQMTLAQECRL